MTGRLRAILACKFFLVDTVMLRTCTCSSSWRSTTGAIDQLRSQASNGERYLDSGGVLFGLKLAGDAGQ